MSATPFDVIIIGSGPGGYVCAIRAAQLGKKVAIIEKYPVLGGTCLNVGCIPSKTLLESADLWHKLDKSAKRHGIMVEGMSLDFGKMVKRKDDVVKVSAKGVSLLMEKNDITVFHGLGSFVDAHTVQVTHDDGETRLTAPQIVIATGSKPASLPELPVDKNRIITSTEALSLPAVPGSMAVIGAGAIGLELGSVYSRLGSQVTVIEYMERILPVMDPDQAAELEKSLRKQKIKFKLGAKVTAAETLESGVRLTVEPRSGGAAETVEAEFCLVCVGRRAYTEGLQPANAGLEIDARGRIQVDANRFTGVEGIYAIGDVVNGPMLAHKAEEEGVFVAELLAGQKPSLHPDRIPNVVYTHPEAASVGLTEEQLTEKKLPFKKGMFPFIANGRARAGNETEGFVKILAHAESDEILGVHMLGARAADMIAEAVLAMEFRASAEDIARTCHPHPTYSEAMKEAALAATGDRALHF